MCVVEQHRLPGLPQGAGFHVLPQREEQRAQLLGGVEDAVLRVVLALGGFAWDAEFLYFSVREPWPSKASTAEITFGKVTPGLPLTLVSQMPENGVIFSDGIETDFLRFNSGTQATVGISAKKGYLVG